MKNRLLLGIALISVCTMAAANAQDRGDRVETRLDKRGDRVDN